MGEDRSRRRSQRRRVRGFIAVLAAPLALWTPQASAASLQELFVKLDTNGDGAIDAQEFQLRKTELFFAQLRNLDTDMTLGPADTNLTEEAFAEADVNGDGRLSGSEFVEARFARFERYDADDDRAITPEEFQSFLSQFLRS